METKTQTQTMMDELEQKRNKLKASTAVFKSAIEGQMGDLKNEAIKWTVRGIIAAGFSIVSYFLIKKLTKNSTQTAPTPVSTHALEKESSYLNPIISSIKVYIATFLLGIAKEFIVRYLEKAFEEYQNDQPNHSQSTEIQAESR